MNVKFDDPNSISIPHLIGLDIDNDPSLKKEPDHRFYIGYDFNPVDAHNYHKPTLYGFRDGKQIWIIISNIYFNRLILSQI